ncbi:MAG: hypothetical protein EXS28_07490 [Pedosphaera sp.]|nr:hypothetical protein [Pedosphaera sp.]
MIPTNMRLSHTLLLFSCAGLIWVCGCSRPTKPGDEAAGNGTAPKVVRHPAPNDLEQRAEGIFFRKGDTLPYSGKVEAFAEDGRKQGEANYVAGKREGLAIILHPNGKVQAALSYKAGHLDGVSRDFSEEGQLMRRRFHANGKLFEDVVGDDARAVEKEFQARQALDATLWKEEELAQKYEETIIDFWDDLRASPDQLAGFEALKFESIQMGKPGVQRQHDWSIRTTHMTNGGALWTNAQWREWLAAERKAGLRVAETEWHQESLTRDKNGQAQSSFRFNIHATRADTRYLVTGSVLIGWATNQNAKGLFQIASLDASRVRVQERTGKTPFTEHRIFDTAKDVPEILPPSSGTGERRRTPKAAPVLVYDLDRDGRSEIMIVNANLLFWNKGGGQFETDSLLRQPPAKEVGAAVLADLTGDGRADLFVVQNFGPPLLYVASANGRFDTLARAVDIAGLDPKISFAATAGDIDGDGDLDLWVTQYMPPYDRGQMPTPYYDANDGWPSFLLLNDGKGNFKEGTEAAGLSPKRTRRTYSASFADLDDDGDMDLVTVNDFSGIDVHLNNGKGQFTDDTARLGDSRHAFGMSHVIADFNRDGRWDVYMTGMGSTTARRLESLKLGRAEFPDHQVKRLKLGYGNRMYYGGAEGLHEESFNDSVARTGWAWGSAALDFDNDGDEDIYISNGHISRKSCRDYCTTYWRHDIYTGTSQTNRVLGSLFNETLKTLETISWNGFEHNVLFMNELKGSAQSYVNVAWVMGVAFEFDARSVVSEDWDADGRPDLLVGRFGWTENVGDQFNYLHLLRNQWEGTHNWIGVRLHENGPGLSPVGAKVAVLYGDKRSRAQFVTGDSWRCQQSNQKHFGLGAATAVDAIEVRWPNGKVSRMEKPAINQYHTILPPVSSTAP